MAENINIRDFIGKRVLLNTSAKHSYAYNPLSGVDELKVLEVSPSGNWVKLMNLNGRKFWVHLSNISFIEALAPIEPVPEKTAS